MHKQSALSRALLGTFGIGMGAFLTVSAHAQTTPQKVEKVEVTGSNIKRVDTETVAPVQVITRDQIERSGQPTVADLLRNIPANSGSFSESFSNSFAPGAAGVSLRGLGQKTTLVLINGRRTAGYGFAQNLQDSFVDLNAIPSSAVERVEILKDGASAIYGSDAIAGVVNVILRKDYKGVELAGSGGRFEGKNDFRFSATAGMGDIAARKFSLMGVFDYYKRDLLMLSDTEFGHTRDMRGHQGGRNLQSLTGGGTWRQLTAAGGFTNNNRAISECRGRVMNNVEARAAGLISAISFAAFDVAGNTFCTQDFNNQFTALPETERAGFLGRANFALSPTATGYAELGLSRVETFQRFQDPFFAGTTGLTQTSAGLRPFTYNITFNPGVAGNPFSTPARYQGVLADFGTRDTRITSDTARLLVGANYSLGTWDLDSAAGYSQNEVESVNINRLTLSGTSSVFGVGSGPQPPVPVATTSRYNLDRWSTNTQAVRDQMRIDFPRKAESELKFIDTKATTELGQIAGGPIGLAVGAEYRREQLKDRPDARAQAGQILGQGITATDGSRNNFATYAELGLPLTRTLEAQLALRHDRYSDYGNSTVPKIGIKYKPTSNLLLRANWGKGFRAPTLPEISPSVATFFTAVIDPLTNAAANISGVFVGNPNLKPEKSTSWTAGAVFEPMKDVSVGVSVYDIDWRDIVASPSFQSIVNAGGPNVIRDPSNNNAIVTVLSGYTNLDQTQVRGVDLDGAMRFRTGLGQFNLRGNLVYVDHYKISGTSYVGTNGGTTTMPRTKGQISLDFDRGPWSTTATLNYVHSYYQALLASSWFTPQAPAFQNGTYPTRVGYYKSFDLVGRYEFNKNLRVTASILNAGNAKPPFDPGASGTFLYDFTTYDIRGRSFRLGVTWKM
jgi:iron complex outermembrane receptor protein